MHVNTSSQDEIDVKTRVNKINFSSRVKVTEIAHFEHNFEYLKGRNFGGNLI